MGVSVNGEVDKLVTFTEDGYKVENRAAFHGNRQF